MLNKKIKDILTKGLVFIPFILLLVWFSSEYLDAKNTLEKSKSLSREAEAHWLKFSSLSDAHESATSVYKSCRGPALMISGKRKSKAYCYKEVHKHLTQLYADVNAEKLVKGLEKNVAFIEKGLSRGSFQKL